MRRLRIGCLVSAMLLSPAFADNENVLTLDKVSFELSAKRWVSSDTAQLTVAINASLNALDLLKVRTDMLAKLGKIVAGDWHITRFERYQDSSGLEKLDVLAQIRVKQSALNHVYDAVKSLSKAGETYSVSGIEFKPGLEETEEAKGSLRQELNKKILAELAQLNQGFSEQHFTISAVTYLEAPLEPSPSRNPTMLAVSSDRAGSQAPLKVSNELIMTAVVEAGSVRK